MQSIANGSNEDNKQLNDSNKDTNNSNDPHVQQNGSSANGIALNGINEQLNDNNTANVSNGTNCDDSDTKLVNIKSRTDQDIIRLIGQHLRVMGLK